MIIEKLHIESFGELREYDIELVEGVNLIEGANESGKSTIAAFVRFMLYGLSSRSRGARPSERERYISWETGMCAGSMELRAHGKRMRIERSLKPAGQSFRETLCVVDLADNSPIQGISSLGEYILGVSEDIFSRTAFIGQLEGARIEGDDLTRAVENILFSANEEVNIASALKKLDASRVALLHKNGAGGLIYDLKLKCSALEQQLELAKSKSREILEKENSLSEAKKKRAELEEKQDRLSAELYNYAISKICELFDLLHETESMTEEYDERILELEQKRESLGTREHIELAESKKRELEEAKSGLAKLEAQIADERAALGDKEQSHSITQLDEEVIALNSSNTRIRFEKILSAVFAAIAFLFIAGGAAVVSFGSFADIGKLLVISSALPIVAAVSLALASLVGDRRVMTRLSKLSVASKEELEEKMQLLKEASDSLRELEARAQDERARCTLLERELRELCADTDAQALITSAHELEKELERMRAEQERSCYAAQTIRAQLEPAYDEAICRSKADLSRDMTEESVKEKEREFDFLKKASEALDVRIRELERELAALYPTSEEPARIGEKLTLGESYIKEYEKKHAAYVLAHEMLEKAGESMRESISPRLAMLTGKYMSVLTGGRYSEIGVDSELKITVRTHDGVKRLALLSEGTQDAAYICLRLALTSVLYKSESPVTVFDESFARFDDDRLLRLLVLLANRNDKIQCIMLTSSRREAALAEKLCGISHISL